MRILGFNITREKAAAVQKMASPAAQEWLRGDDVDQEGAVLTNAYQQVAWVYRAINVLAEQVANIPFLFSSGERGHENLITSGPLVDFYDHPHPQINRFEYWELRVIWLMLRGECVRIPIYSDSPHPRPLSQRERGGASDATHQLSTNNNQRRLSRVLILDPAQFQHIVQDHQLIGWRYTGFGPETPLASQVFLPEEVWFEKLPNPFNFWRGLAPLHAAAMAAKTDFAASAFMRGLIENNADTGLVVRTEKPLSPEQRDQLIAALRGRKRRVGTADRPLLLWNTAEIVKPELSSSDLQFLENRKFSRAEICAAIGVPEEIVTTTDHSKYDVMQGARLNFIENRVAPLCRRLEAAEAVTVRSLDPRATGWFDLESLAIMQQARRNRLVTAKTGFDMGVPFNELNRVFDLGFRRLPWGDDGYLPANLQKLEKGNSKLENLNFREAQNSKFQTPNSRKNPNFKSQSGPIDAVEQMNSWLAGLQADSTSADNARLERKLSRFLFEQRQRVLANLERVLGVHPTGCSGTSELGVHPSGCSGETASNDDTLKGGHPAAVGVDIRRDAHSTPQTELVDQLFNLADENRRLDEQVGPVPEFRALNEAILVSLWETLRNGIENHESSSQLAGRLRALYNRNKEFSQKNGGRNIGTKESESNEP